MLQTLSGGIRTQWNGLKPRLWVTIPDLKAEAQGSYNHKLSNFTTWNNINRPVRLFPDPSIFFIFFIFPHFVIVAFCWGKKKKKKESVFFKFVKLRSNENVGMAEGQLWESPLVIQLQIRPRACSGAPGEAGLPDGPGLHSKACITSQESRHGITPANPISI